MSSLLPTWPNMRVSGHIFPKCNLTLDRPSAQGVSCPGSVSYRGWLSCRLAHHATPGSLNSHGVGSLEVHCYNSLYLNQLRLFVLIKIWIRCLCSDAYVSNLGKIRPFVAVFDSTRRSGWLAGWLTDEYNTTLRPILRSLWDRIGLSSGPSVAITKLLYI